MDKQNVTLSLPKTLLKKAKLLAVQKDESLSQLLKKALEEKVRAESGYKTAGERQLKLLSKGFDFGEEGCFAFSREALHDR